MATGVVSFGGTGDSESDSDALADAFLATRDEAPEATEKKKKKMKLDEAAKLMKGEAPEMPEQEEMKLDEAAKKTLPKWARGVLKPRPGSGVTVTR